MALKASSLAIYKYLKEHPEENFTSEDLAKILGLTKRSVDGSFTSAIQRKKDANDNFLGERVEAEIELDDGTHKSVKYLKLTPAGMAYDPEAPEA